MRKIVFALFALLLLAAPLATVKAAPVGIPILIDLSHGQPVSGVDMIMRMVPEAQWYILVKSAEDVEALPPQVKALAYDILIGDFASVNLEKYGIQMIIIGQPQTLFKPDEITNIVAWFTKYPGRAIWVAADSDYPAQGSETAQHAVNMILEAIGAKLRMDYVSIEDSASCAYKPYRVLGIVNPDPEVAVLGYACEKVLFHGPGAVAWVDDAGNWHKVTKSEKPENVYVVVTTTDKGEVVEHQAEPRGTTGKAYMVGETGVFTLMAVELVKVGKGYGKVIVSGESPYGGYQPMSSWMYKGIVLSGPRFIRNVILWATGYLGELKEYEKLAKLPGEVKKTLEEKTAELEGKIKPLVDEAKSAAASVSGTATAALGLAIVALIVALAAVFLAVKKK